MVYLYQSLVFDTELCIGSVFSPVSLNVGVGLHEVAGTGEMDVPTFTLTADLNWVWILLSVCHQGMLNYSRMTFSNLCR